MVLDQDALIEQSEAREPGALIRDKIVVPLIDGTLVAKVVVDQRSERGCRVYP